MKKTDFLVSMLVLTIFLGICPLGPLVRPVFSQGFMYQEFDGIMLFYIPKGTKVYRELLPKVFDLPDQPLVEIFDIDYYKMAPKTLDPYREIAVFLLAKYKGEEVWHCITMPVTSDEARIGGIRYLGYPKVLADIEFVRESLLYRGNLKANGKTILELSLDTKGRSVGDEEREWFRRLTGIPSLNYQNGKLIDPVPAARKVKINVLELAEKMPGTFKVQVGQANLIGYPEAAPKENDWRPKAFAIEVKEIVLAYYFQNKYGFSFGLPKVVSD